MKKEVVKISALFIILLLWSVEYTEAITYYVSTSGNDNNPGTQSSPFKTLQKGANVCVAGDIVYVRGGTYTELSNLNMPGTAAKPVLFRNYPGEKVVLDGQYTIPNSNPASPDPVTGNQIDDFPMVMVQGTYITVKGFEIKRSKGVGITVTYYPSNSKCHNNTIDSCEIHDCRGKALFVYKANDITIIRLRAYRTGDVAPRPHCSGPDWPSAVQSYGSSRTIFSQNEIFLNWGEGIGIWNCDNATAEDNVCYDNMSGQIYLDNSLNCTIQRNLIYHTKDPTTTCSGGPPDGLNMADESSISPPRGSGNKIVNNCFWACQNSLRWRNFQLNSGLKNTLIANNTIVNPSNGNPLNFETGSHSNNQIINNIIVQDNTNYSLASVANLSAFTFSNNLWSRNPGTSYVTANDVIGDPRLTKMGSTTKGVLTKNWFMLTPLSPAINKSTVVSGITTDMFNLPRDSKPDIGAHEYSGSPAAITSPMKGIEEVNVYPIPTNQSAVIRYRLAENSTVKISIIDVLGNEATQVTNEKQTAGEHQLTLNTENLRNGVYFVKMIVNNQQVTEKLMVHK